MANSFSRRHIGITDNDLPKMLETVGVQSVDHLIEQTIPANIRLQSPLDLPAAMSEQEYLTHIRALAQKNKIADNYIGLGYYGTATPSVILRNIFENPVWYTSYTPYQAEISQGRLEALLNFQTMISDITALPLANCSLLDEATAAAEAMTMFYALRSRAQQKEGLNRFFVDKNIFPQTLDVLTTRSVPQGIELVIGDYSTIDLSEPFFGALLQYPAANGTVCDYRQFVENCKAANADMKIAVAADLMALTLLTPPGEWGADVVLGTTQRFGMPLYFGGPSAAYFATREEYKRFVPGRIVGVSKDDKERPAYRLALQSREQHIKREKALSNICTAQALCATMSGFYALYHGNDGLVEIAKTIHRKAQYLSNTLAAMGCTPLNANYFDTVRVELPNGLTTDKVRAIAEPQLVNFLYRCDTVVSIAVDELTTCDGIKKILAIFAEVLGVEVPTTCCCTKDTCALPAELVRQTKPLNHDIFEKYHSETEMMRYIKSLDRKDISLTHSMISLGSCTMKLNAATEMLPLSWAEFTNIHPFAPDSQTEGYRELIANLERQLAIITGFAGTSLQPNSGASGEYAGLTTIRRYQAAQGESHRNLVLIPSSAHGTNPASASQAGMDIIVTACDENGNVDVEDIRKHAEANRDRLSALMITYPSTHGIFEPEIVEICNIIHANGGQVYMDGANMNGQVGLTSPGTIGADVCHLNLHKTFAMPHGGGGPGVGPICVAEHLVDFLPSHFTVNECACACSLEGLTKNAINTNKAVAAARWGSAGLLPITYGYICMMGADGLADATKMAIFSANYLTKSLEKAYGIVYTGATGRVGHEMILDCRHLKAYANITESDVAKRMMDFGFHAPTLSFPVHGTLMVEPTESEPLAELDRFIDMMLAIRQEIEDVHTGAADPVDNVLMNSPHAEYRVVSDEWNHSYGREKAAYPLAWVRENKFWVPVGRVDNGWGDRNLICSCQG